MNVADYIIIGVLVLSMGLAFFRGFAVEALSLIIWIASFVVARLFSSPLAEQLADMIDPPSARVPIAFVTLVILVLLLGALVKHFVKKMVDATGLSGVDRLLGSIFGLVRGSLLVVIGLAVVSRITQMPEDPWWQASLLIPHFMVFEQWTAELGQEIWGSLMSMTSDS